jgi:V/A-type H+-transporting ATPase subunit F
VAVRPGDDLGFRLAGAEVRTIAEGEEAGAFRALLADPHLGALCADEALLAAAPPHLLARARARGLPILLPFSPPRRWGEAGRGQAWVAALLRRAVGYGVRLAGGPGAGHGGTP